MIAVPAAASPANGPALRDIHMPPAPAWWPPAPGWWIVTALALLCVGAGLWLWRRHRRRRASEQALVAAVDALVARHRQRPQQLAAGLHALLRRAALRLDGANSRQGGEAWRATLASVMQDAPTLDTLMMLEAAMYKPKADFDIDAAAAAVRRWLLAAWRQRNRRARMAPSRGLLSESGHA
ncbi:DUF4381 family protein [Dyella sp. EPa41]|uniref:DUF4381 family protein n=1 Tax=Dyella sp. EPa41 TaxID=1561194 RepID=UPI001915A682|nr:DUF4381 family protein [Dyella sp. EPa41]